MDERGGFGWQQIGAHRLRLEPPDLVYLVDRGDVSPAEMAHILDAVRPLAAAHGPLLWLNDVSGLEDLPVETRKFLAGSDLLSLVGAVAVIGATFTRRIIARMVLNVGRLTQPGTRIPELRFFASEAEARAWLEELRRPGKE